MIVSGLMSGGAPVIQSYQIGAVTNVAGEALYASATAGAGLLTRITEGTGLANYVGMATNVATPSTTQGSAESLARVIVNGDALIRSRMAGSATSGSDVGLLTITTADSSGLTLVDSALTITSHIDGYFWGISGANVGQVRICTSAASSTATFTQPFDNGTVVGDTFGYSTIQPAGVINEPLLTTDATEVDVTTTQDESSSSFVPMAFDLNGVADSYVLMGLLILYMLATALTKGIK